MQKETNYSGNSAVSVFSAENKYHFREAFEGSNILLARNIKQFFIIIIIIIMFMKVQGCFLFLDSQDVVGPSISSSVVLRSFVPLFHIVVLVLVVYLCPSSVRVVATFSVTVLFP